MKFTLVTSLSLAGMKLPADFHGQPFFGPDARKREFYDLQTDPWEFRNLAAVPEHQQTLARLRETLDRWMKDTHDDGGTPENPAALRRILEDHARKMKAQFGKGKP